MWVPSAYSWKLMWSEQSGRVVATAYADDVDELVAWWGRSRVVASRDELAPAARGAALAAGTAQPTTRNAGTAAGLHSSSHSTNSSGDIGRPIQKPWARSQPSSCSRRKVASSSTPSATTS